MHSKRNCLKSLNKSTRKIPAFGYFFNLQSNLTGLSCFGRVLIEANLEKTQERAKIKHAVNLGVVLWFSLLIHHQVGFQLRASGYQGNGCSWQCCRLR